MPFSETGRQVAMTVGERDPWTQYWARGYLHSCPNAFAGNYDDAVRAFWRDFFSPLADGSSVLDIGTGNGAIALLARDTARSLGHTFAILGADRAAIDPEAALRGKQVDYSGVAFASGVCAESTGFEPGRFDAISSHYVIEYTQLDRTVPELARILAPGGRIGCILHHSESIVAATSKDELSHLSFLLSESAVLDRAADLLRAMGAAMLPAQIAALRDDARAEACRLALNAATARVSERIRAGRHVDLLQFTLGEIAKAFRERTQLGPERTLAGLLSVKEELVASQDRLRDLLSAALSEPDLNTLAARFASAGLHVERRSELRHSSGKLLGWSLVACKAPDP